MSGSQDAPFRAIVNAPDAATALNPSHWPADSDDPAWSPEDLEVAYQRALEAADLADQLATDELAAVSPAEPAPEDQVVQAPLNTGPEVLPSPESHQTAPIGSFPSVGPAQVLEAILFVGGEPLTGKRLADLLGGETGHEQVDELIADMNRRYLEEGRPYEVRLAEGGYRLELSAEYEPIRSRVYGLGPRDVKLSQDVLEVLAFIAYRQPVDKGAIEETGKSNVGTILRQLLRRELIALERGKDDDQVRYRTTPRFLELFGLREIEDLPQPDDLMFK